MKFNLIKEFGIIVIYIAEINYSIIIDDKKYRQYLGKDEICYSEVEEITKELYPKELNRFKSVWNNYKISCKRENNLKESYGLKKNPCFVLCIHGTRRCNLQCKYCFGNEEYLPKEEISIETAKKAIDYLVFEYGKNGKMYNIDLAGSGEPLLRFEFVQEIEEYCNKIRNITGKKVIITFPTNATLLRQEHIRYFEKHPDILYGFSIDGDKKCNSNRTYFNGISSFEDALKGIKLSTNEHSGFSVTVTSNNEGIDQIYEYLYSLNKGDAISTRLVRDFTDSETSLYHIDIDNLIKGYRNLTNSFIEHFKNNDFDYIIPLLNGNDFYGRYILKVLKNETHLTARCDAAKSRLAVDEKGNLYACSVMNGKEDFCIGNIVEGIDKEKQKKFTQINVMHAEKCQKCWCHNICCGECMAVSYLCSGKLYEPNPFMCEIRQQLIAMAIGFVEYIKTTFPEIFEQLINYIKGTKYYYQTHPAVWAVVNYLNYSSLKVTYREIANVIEAIPYNEGPSVLDLEKLIKKYNPEDCAVSVQSIEDLPNISAPMLSIYRGYKDVYSYALLKKNEEGKYTINTLDNLTSEITLSDELIQQGFNVFIGPFEDYL